MSKIFKSLGLMSGTSLDGIDAAILKTDGKKIYEFGPKLSYEYTNAERKILKNALDITPQIVEDFPKEDIKQNLVKSSQAIAKAEKIITKTHIYIIKDIIKASSDTWKSIDIIGFPGQTIFHNPKQKITLQIGDAQKIANNFDTPLIANFRENDVKYDGEGAPFAPIYHQALANMMHLPPPIIFVNIGGVANITYINKKSNSLGNNLLAFDTGPGNALMDDLMMDNLGKKFDKYGELAMMGNIDNIILNELLNNPYFKLTPPKSLDRNHFNLSKNFTSLSLKNKMANLNAFTAISIAKSLDFINSLPKSWIICGGGRKNDKLVSNIRYYLKQNYYKGQEFTLNICEDIISNNFKLDGDYIEAEAFAFLAVRSFNQLPLSFPSTTRVNKPVNGGAIYLPNQ